MFGRKPPVNESDLTDEEFDFEESGWVPEWASRWLERFGIYVSIILLLVIFLALSLSGRVFQRVQTGERGVRWSLFGGGTVLDRDYPEGLRIIPPWDRLDIYDVRVQEVSAAVVVLTSNGLPITVTYSVRYRPDLNRVPHLHQNYGPNYSETLIRPEIVSAIREVIGNYRPEEIYSRSEQGLVDEVYQSLASQLTNRFVVIQTVIIKELRLTPELEHAIDMKLVDEQDALAYEFRLDQERSEALRKQIEAEGILAFEQTSGVSMLKWRGIEATEELAKSPNSKVILIGSGDSQLPIILSAAQ